MILHKLYRALVERTITTKELGEEYFILKQKKITDTPESKFHKDTKIIEMEQKKMEDIFCCPKCGDVKVSRGVDTRRVDSYVFMKKDAVRTPIRLDSEYTGDDDNDNDDWYCGWCGEEFDYDDLISY